MLISDRGDFGERDPWQTEGGGVTEVGAARAAHSSHAARRSGDRSRAASRKAQTLAYSSNKPVALLLTRDLMWEERMTRLDALRAVYDRLDDCAVVTIMGAVAAELQSIGHRPNFFYLQHAMGLASSVGLGIALEQAGSCRSWCFDGDGSVLMNLGGLTTLARYRPAQSRARRLRQRDRCCRSAAFPPPRAPARDLADVAAAAGVPRTAVRDDARRVREALRRRAQRARSDDARREGRRDRAGGVRHRPRLAREPLPVSALPASRDSRP